MSFKSVHYPIVVLIADIYRSLWEFGQVGKEKVFLFGTKAQL